MRERLSAIVTIVRLSVAADPWRCVLALVINVARTSSLLATAALLGATAQAVADGDTGRAVAAAALLGAVYLLKDASTVITFPLEMRTRETGGHALDVHLLQLMSSIPGIEHFERPEHADKVKLLDDARPQLANFVAVLVANAAQLVLLVGTGIVLARVSPWFLLLAVAGVPSLWAANRSTRLRLQVFEDLAEPGRVLDGLFDTMTTAEPSGEVRVFGLEPELRRRHLELCRTIDRSCNRLALRTQVVENAAWLVSGVALIGALGLLGHRALRGETTIGEVVVTVTLGNQVRLQLTQAERLSVWLIESLKAADHYAWIRHAAKASITRLTSVEPAEPPDRLVHGIELRNVTFRYPGTDTNVLHDIDVLLPAGATVAVVGDNGAGKSTLVKLLARLHEPTAGEILVDGRALAAIAAPAWRARTSAAFQDFMRPELHAQHVVGMGHLPEIDDPAAVTAALDRAAGVDVLASLPAGLETQVGRAFADGVELSGGEWQKLALGRGMMRQDPLLLLLDEPTSALDARTEHALFERFAGAARRVAARSGGITLLVSHRFSTVRMADLIIVVADNRIAEHGTHAELMSRAGLYAELFELQARAYR
jgi:ATP-binding cassette subfamily B protein